MADVKNDLASRLREAVASRGIRQVDLASAIGSTQPAVSAFLAGHKTPSTETLGHLAHALGVDIDWLVRGRGSSAKSNPLTNSRSEVDWHFRTAYGDGTMQFGNTRTEVLPSSLAMFGRETGQNLVDAGLGSEVLSEFILGILSGEHLERFKSAIRWDVLEPHYKAIASDREHRTTRRYRDGLEKLRHDKSLWVMRVDDYGTIGLLGDDFDTGPFEALVRRSQDSQKQDESSGGRFGLGSSVLSSHSAFDLVLFSSNLSRPVNGRTKGRLIGRTFFPYHGVKGDEFEGPSFFGIPEKGTKRVLSAWAHQELLEDLWLKRNDAPERVAATGTSLLVVGFFDPMQDMLDQKPGDVIDGLAEVMAECFWPAIATGRLRCRFSLHENDKLVTDRVLDSSTISHPCVSLLSGGTEPGRELVVRDIPLRVPKSRDGQIEAQEHNARLAVQLLDKADDRPHVNDVAMWRKPHMVVRYKPFSGLTLGAKPFRAALICGEAVTDASPSAADVAADRFLAKAEPPAHNDWTSESTDLVAEYWGGKTALREFERRLKETLREIVAPQKSGDTSGPPDLKRLLAFPLDAEPRRRVYTSQIMWDDPKTFASITAVIRLSAPAEMAGVPLRPTLISETETGGGVPISCDLLALSNCIVNQNTVVPADSAREIKIRMIPQWRETDVRPEFSAFSLEVSAVTPAA